jgi:hypothetical protein
VKLSDGSYGWNHAPSRSKYSPDESYVAALLAVASDRCRNNRNVSYPNYGGRGIKFMFASVEEGAKWIVANLGPCPKGKSIDRIDNNRHYEPGNLRWATRTEQARNKREYKGSVYGHRMNYLCAQRPDYTYEGLRKYVLLGYTDAEIVAMKKPGGGRPRKC